MVSCYATRLTLSLNLFLLAPRLPSPKMPNPSNAPFSVSHVYTQSSHRLQPTQTTHKTTPYSLMTALLSNNHLKTLSKLAKIMPHPLHQILTPHTKACHISYAMVANLPWITMAFTKKNFFNTPLRGASNSSLKETFTHPRLTIPSIYLTSNATGPHFLVMTPSFQATAPAVPF